jgi:hypothetical protein
LCIYDPPAAARAARAARAERAAIGPGPAAPAAVRDPLPYCIYATVALLAWLLSPALVVACFAALGLRKYWRAYRAGLRASDCILGDPRRVMAYLGALLIAGAGWTIYALFVAFGG